MNRRLPFVLVTIGLPLACAACACQEIERGFERRCDNLRKSTGWLIEAEQRRPSRLEYTCQVIHEQHEHDVQKACVDNPATAKQWTEEEFTRWKEQAPIHLQRTIEQLSGNLENIERTVPMIVN